MVEREKTRPYMTNIKSQEDINRKINRSDNNRLLQISVHPRKYKYSGQSPVVASYQLLSRRWQHMHDIGHAIEKQLCGSSRAVKNEVLVASTFCCCCN
jgi:hypothetical protein